MFNPKQFESAVYAFVTDEVNKAVSKFLKNKENMQTQGLQFYRQVMKALHEITEEIAAQILVGLLLMHEKDPPRKGKSKTGRSPSK